MQRPHSQFISLDVDAVNTTSVLFYFYFCCEYGLCALIWAVKTAFCTFICAEYGLCPLNRAVDTASVHLLVL